LPITKNLGWPDPPVASKIQTASTGAPVRHLWDARLGDYETTSVIVTAASFNQDGRTLIS
jgi:hypothetical protein